MNVLFERVFGRWERKDDPLQPALPREPVYRVAVVEAGDQMFIHVLPALEDQNQGGDHEACATPTSRPQLGVMLEINQGMPCVHLYQDPRDGDVALSVFGTGDKLMTRRGDAFDRVEPHEEAIPLTTADAVARLFGTREFSAFSNHLPTEAGRLQQVWGVMEHTTDGPHAVCEPCLSESTALAMVAQLQNEPDISWADLVRRLAEGGHQVPEIATEAAGSDRERRPLRPGSP